MRDPERADSAQTLGLEPLTGAAKPT